MLWFFILGAIAMAFGFPITGIVLIVFGVLYEKR